MKSCSMISVLFIVIGVVSLNAEQIDWSEDTYAIWPRLKDAPEQTAVVSWSDWMVFDHAVHGKPGVRYILNKMAASGIRTVWWRTFGGGWALYPSEVAGVTTGNYSGQGADYSQYDSLVDAVEYGHKLGLKVYAWFTPLEEAHGWPDNVRSHYVDARRDQWDVTKMGVPVDAPSFYYPGYRQYKSDLAREMISRYDVDGIVIDFERRGSPARNDSWGYLPQILGAFKHDTGLDAKSLSSRDPRWQRFRAQYVGVFMRDLRRYIDAQSRPIELIMMFPPDQPLAAHWDAETWAKQGLIDKFVLVQSGPEGWGSPVHNSDSLLKQYDSWKEPKSLILYALKADRRLLANRVRAAIDAGWDDIVWFETTYLHFNKTYDVPRDVALPISARLQSPLVDLTDGGEVVVLAAGNWKLFLNDRPIAEGDADIIKRVTLPQHDGQHRLTVLCELTESSQRAGVVVQGKAGDATIHTDATWRSDDSNHSEVITIAQPGIPPFLGEAR